MKRRKLLGVLAGAAMAWPLTSRAQQPDRARRLGVLMFFAKNDPEGPARLAVLREALQKLGWSDGGNIQIDYRFYMGNVNEARKASAELMKESPDVIISSGAGSVNAFQELTRTVPTVFVMVNTLVANGFVQNLARPRGNITGVTTYEPIMGAKWLELIREIAPRLTRVAVMFNPNTLTLAAQYFTSAEAVSQKDTVELLMAQVRSPADIEASITALGQKPDAGLIVVSDGFMQSHRKLIIQLAARYGLPAIYPFRLFADDGGLISYGIDTTQVFRQAATYVDRILRGERAANLPILKPTKFDLVINLRTARTLGLTVPATLLARADHVIE